MPNRRFLAALAAVLLIVVPFSGPKLVAQQAPQKMDKETTARALQVLHDAEDAVKKHYYDPKFHGVDVDARYNAYAEKIQGAPSLGQAFGFVAGFMEELKDSHTFFEPPSRPFRVDYGYRMEIIGNNCFVTRVRPGTDAAAKVKPGDQVLGFNTFALNRGDFNDAEYYFDVLAPLKASQLALRSPDGQQRTIVVDAKYRDLKKVLDLTGSDGGFDISELIRNDENADRLVEQRWREKGDVVFWQMPDFLLEDNEVDRIFSDVRKHKALVLDLRENPGGSINTLERVIGSLFDHDVKIGDRVGRKEMKPEIAKTRGDKAFSGKLIVLVDSRSSSAAELLSRIVQLEHRGTVIGDRTAGAVMEARGYGYSQGTDTQFFYGFSVTEADIIMSDGKSLEHTGVTPDEIVLPTADDMANGRDPVLARASELAEAKVDATEAGKIFPFQWPKD